MRPTIRQRGSTSNVRIQLDHVPSAVNAGLHFCNKKVSVHSISTGCLFTQLVSCSTALKRMRNETVSFVTGTRRQANRRHWASGLPAGVTVMLQTCLLKMSV